MTDSEIRNSPAHAAQVARLYELNAQLDQVKAALDAAKLDLILLDAPGALADKVRAKIELTPAERLALKEHCGGKYADAENRVATVTIPTEGSVSFDLYREDELRAWLAARGHKRTSPKLTREFQAEREAKARELCGEHFTTLFDRFEIFAPCKAFGEILDRLFAKAKAKRQAVLDFLATTKAPTEPYVRLEKPKPE